MKKVFFITAIFSFLLMNACGGKQISEETRTNENTNGRMIEVQVPNPFDPNAPSNSNTNAPNSRDLVNTAVADPTSKAKPLEIPGTYDSLVSTTMTKQGKFLETRTFKNDSQVLKVERLQELKEFKLYLKNGKVIPIPYEQAENLYLHASPRDLLEAAGIKPPPPPKSDAAPAKKQ